MKTTNLKTSILSGLWIFLMAVMVSCGPGRETAQDRREAREPRTTEEAIETLDTRIRDLNQELASVERDIRANGRTVEGDMEESWEQIEQRRQELNRHIERYNAAVQREAELEAAEIRKEIDNKLNVLEQDVDEFRTQFARETEGQEDRPN
jgi:prefoldin subunit 5